MQYTLTSILSDLATVSQNKRHHPEGNALAHSLQVYNHAFKSTDDPELWAAALLHDIGKVDGNKDHAYNGAQMIKDLLSPRITWLIEHHMDLAHHSRRTRRKYRNTTQLHDLEHLRRWDLAGRKPNAHTPSLFEAVDTLCLHLDRQPLAPNNPTQEHEK